MACPALGRTLLHVCNVHRATECNSRIAIDAQPQCNTIPIGRLRYSTAVLSAEGAGFYP